MNQVILIGNVGLISYDNQKEDKERCVMFTLATNRKWLDRAGNEVVKTAWHKITVFGQMAGFTAKNIKTGSRVTIIGRISYSEYIDKNNIKQYSTSIITESINISIK